MTSAVYLNQGQELAAGWNNAANLRNITALIGTDNKRFYAVDDFGRYQEGVPELSADLTVDYEGFATTEFISAALTRGQYKYLKNTILGGALSGRVTVRCHNDVDVLANYNAILTLPLVRTLERDGANYRNVIWSFTLIAAL